MWLLPSLLILALVSYSRQTITIELSGEFTNKSLEKYTDEEVFTDRYANFPKDNELSGYIWLWESFPNNACQYITPLPASVKVNSSKWFALVEVKEDFRDCASDMLDNVRNAGFDLIVGYSNSSSIPSVPKSLRNSQFPVVAISKNYASTLWDVAATDTLTDAVLARVTVEDLDVAVVGIIMGTGMLFLCSCVTLCCLMFCMYRNRRGQYAVHSRHIHDDPYHQRYAQARMARQELIENILRQLQELQGEYRIPLGEEGTKALPLRKFTQSLRESTTKENCAICVEEFQENDQIRVLPCNHFFHPDCIDPWLISHSSLCPLCKQSVSQNEPQPSGARPRVFLETTEDEESNSLESFATPVLALTDVADSPSPVHPPTQSQRAAADSSSISSDTPLLDHGLPTNYSIT